MTIRNRIIFTLNALYSVLWIAAHDSDKHEYREKSLVHGLLVSLYRF